MTTTNRRNIVAGLLAAATLPAAATAAPADPIFALIETAKAAALQDTEHTAAMEDFRETLPDEVTRFQRVLVGQNGDEPIYAESHTQIDAFFENYSGHTLPGIRFLGLRLHGREQLEAAERQFEAELMSARAEAHAELNRDISRMQAAQESSGLTALENDSNDAFDERCDADFDVMQCHPSTVAGAAAKVKYMAERIRDGAFGDDDHIAESLEHLRDSLALAA